MRPATSAGTPCPVSPLNSAAGSVEARPRISIEKKMPIERTVAPFWNVAVMPAAAPRWRAGTLFMIEARFGDENRPIASPLTASRIANR